MGLKVLFNKNKENYLRKKFNRRYSKMRLKREALFHGKRKRWRPLFFNKMTIFSLQLKSINHFSKGIAKSGL